MNELTSGFITLFRGRGDVWGHDDGFCVREPVTPDVWSNHLNGIVGMGVYPSLPTPQKTPICAWGCTDIDTDDWPQARLLQRTLDAAGITSWIERSRSKGYHVWVFASSPVSAQDMRNLQLVAHMVADLQPKEVNPKQIDVSVRKIGNYVRLPYLGGLIDTPQRRVIIDADQNPVPLDEFVPAALASRNAADKISALASLYQTPQHQHITYSYGNSPSASLAEGIRKLSPLGYIIWRDGPLPGNDRSSTLVRLGYVCAECGLTPSECRAVITDADARWGKYRDHPNGEEELDKIVQRAYR